MFFFLFEEPRKKLKNVPLATSLRASLYVIKSFADYQKIHFGTKKKHINWFKASINCSMWVVYWPLLNRFSGDLLNILLMSGLHHSCLPENFRKVFQNTGRLLLILTFIKFWFLKKEIIVRLVFHPFHSDFYNYTVFVTSRYLSRESFPSLLKIYGCVI